MSLATRCSSCGTTFRVVQDQLKVSEGWVRCGRCEAVFNAVEGLFDLERDAPELPASSAPAKTTAPADAVKGSAVRSPPMTPVRGAGPKGTVVPPTARAPVATPAPVPVAAPVPSPGAASVPAMVTPTASVAVPAMPVSREADADAEPEHEPPVRVDRPGPKPPVGVGARDRLEFSDARFDSDLFEDPRLDGDDTGAAPPTAAGDLPLESEMSPDFLRRAERRPGWRPEPSHGLVGSLVALSVLLLGLQAALHGRAAIASAWPWTHGALDAACAVAGCTLEAPRRIDALSVESTALARAVGQDGFVLTVALRNRSAAALVTPAVDLTLTDGAGRLVARRALAPAELRAAPTIAAGADLQLQAALDVRGARVAGYTVEIFYP